MNDQSIFIVTMIGAALLYIGLGALYTKHLLLYVPWLRTKAEFDSGWLIACTLTWPAVFIALITWCALESLIEPLTRSREGDWQESFQYKHLSITSCPECEYIFSRADVVWMMNEGKWIGANQKKEYQVPCIECGVQFSLLRMS